jgi:hypothetical protein
MQAIVRAALAAGLVLAVAGSCTKDATGPHNGPPRSPDLDSLGPGIVGTTTVDGTPAFTLANGKVVLLDDVGQTLDWLQRFPPALSASSASFVSASAVALPSSVDLRQYQTPIRDQGGRGTCTSFAALAAIEAAYKRTYGVSLDLSEEYAVRISKMVGLYLDLAPSQREDPPATWNGGTATFVLQVFASGKLGLPVEKWLPYISTENWGNTAQQGDMPYLDDNSSQRAVDDFNLTGGLVTYKIPETFATVMLPQAALDSASYRVTQVLYAAPSDEQSVAWFKTQLAGGHEVAFGVHLTKHSKTVNGVWMPGDTVFDGHAMLMVGYDDSKQAFLLKNSWGTAVGDSGYYWFSYNWVTTEVVFNDNKVPPYKVLPIQYAAVVLGVAPPNSPTPPEQRLLGRWSVDHDGLHGRLDIYHIPGLFSANDLHGHADYRLGTYFGPDNVARRVNGVITGNQLEAYIDWSNSGSRAVDDLSGLHFTGLTMRDSLDDPTYLAGSYVDNRDGRTYGFYGHKGGYLQPTPAPAPSLTAYLGTWETNLDGTWGIMRITSVDSSNWSIHGSFVDNNNASSAVAGLVSLNRPDNVYSLLVGNRQLVGYMFNQESGVLAGSGQGGFVAYHYNSPPSVQITYPTQNATLDFDLNLLSGTALHASASDLQDGTPCCTVEWEMNGVSVASGANATYAFSDTGSNYVTAIATDLDGATTRTSVSFRLVNNPPTATILKPTGGQHFITGITYNDAVEAQTWLTGQGKTITYTWASSDGSDNFPKAGAKPTNVVFGTPGARTLTVTVADNYGLQAQATVNVVVDTQPTAPSIQFLSPLDQDNIQSLSSDTLIWLNIQIAPSSVQGRVISLVWQGDTQYCIEQTATIVWNNGIQPPPDAKQVYGFWNTAPLNGPCFAHGVNGYLRLYVTDPNVATQMAQVRLYNPPDPH